jgi:hypothetical protein
VCERTLPRLAMRSEPVRPSASRRTPRVDRQLEWRGPQKGSAQAHGRRSGGGSTSTPGRHSCARLACARSDYTMGGTRRRPCRPRASIPAWSWRSWATHRCGRPRTPTAMSCRPSAVIPLTAWTTCCRSDWDRVPGGTGTPARSAAHRSRRGRREAVVGPVREERSRRRSCTNGRGSTWTAPVIHLASRRTASPSTASAARRSLPARSRVSHVSAAGSTSPNSGYWATRTIRLSRPHRHPFA